MKRLLCTAALLALVAGCGEPQNKMAHMSGPPQKAKPAPEMKMLEPMVGAWTGKAEFVTPTREEMMKMMPAGSPPMPESFPSGGHAEWVFGGTYLKNSGWMDMGGQRAEFVELMTWDPTVGKFRSWYFNDMGERGEGLMTMSPDGRNGTMRVTGVRGDGSAMLGEGTMKIDPNGNHEWTWSEKMPGGGKMMLHGTTHYARDGSAPAAGQPAGNIEVVPVS